MRILAHCLPDTSWLNMTITLGIYFLLVVCGLIFRKNKYLVLDMAVFMLLMYALTMHSPDYNTYSYRYYYSANILDISEVGFTLFVNVINFLKIPYVVYVGILVFLSIAFPVYLIYRYSPLPAFTMSLYMLYSLPIDLIQIRSSMAFNIALFGIYIFWRNKYQKIIIPLLFIIIASLFHTASIFYLFFLFIVLLKDKKYFKEIVISSFIVLEVFALAIFPNPLFRNWIAGFMNVDYFLSHALVSGFSIPGFTAKALFAAVAFLYLSSGYKSKELNDGEKAFIELSQLINLAVIFSIPAYVLGVDMYRIQRNVLFILYIAVSIILNNIYKTGERKDKIKYSIVAAVIYLLLVYAFFFYSKDYISTLWGIMSF